MANLLERVADQLAAIREASAEAVALVRELSQEQDRLVAGAELTADRCIREMRAIAVGRVKRKLPVEFFHKEGHRVYAEWCGNDTAWKVLEVGYNTSERKIGEEWLLTYIGVATMFRSMGDDVRG